MFLQLVTLCLVQYRCYLLTYVVPPRFSGHFFPCEPALAGFIRADEKITKFSICVTCIFLLSFLLLCCCVFVFNSFLYVDVFFTCDGYFLLLRIATALVFFYWTCFFVIYIFEVISLYLLFFAFLFWLSFPFKHCEEKKIYFVCLFVCLFIYLMHETC